MRKTFRSPQARTSQRREAHWRRRIDQKEENERTQTVWYACHRKTPDSRRRILAGLKNKSAGTFEELLLLHLLHVHRVHGLPLGERIQVPAVIFELH